MAGQNGSYYESQKSKLLKDFDKTAGLVRGFVVARHGEGIANSLFNEARREYEAIIPQIPHIEGSRGMMLNSFLRITAQEIAVYKAMKKLGRTPREAWEICHKALRLRMEKFPKFKRWLLQMIIHSGLLRRRVRKLANEKRKFDFGDFEITWTGGDDKDFDYGVDYLACGNYKLALDLGAEEFAPYICMSDIALSDALGWGLIRTETLADGCKRCDFRFKKGGKTQITSKTPEVQETIEKIAQKEAAS